jgi:hypothetical protein
MKRLFVAIALIVAVPVRGGATVVATSPLKAAFLVNFANFTTWPAATLPVDGPIVVCVIGDEAIAQILEAASDKGVAGHHLAVRRVDAENPDRTCHMLYVSNITTMQAVKLLERLKGSPILLVSDLVEFSSLGGTITLLVEENRLRFAINVDAAQRSGLHLSAKLLSLAKIVKDG